MNKIALAVAFLISAPVFAGTSGTQTQDRTATSQSQTQTTTASSNSDSQATNAGNTQSIVFSSPETSSSKVEYSGTTTVKNVPSVNAPPLTSSNDTCMGSVSGAVNVAGFGAAIGSTYKDANCVMLKNSRELWNMGMRGAALARMCMDAENREALEITGFKCPQTERAEKDAAAKAAVVADKK